MKKGIPELNKKYGPEVKHRRGLNELIEVIGQYDDPPGSSAHPMKVFVEMLSAGNCTILDVGSGWEKEAVDAQHFFGEGVNWVALNPMLKDAVHNQRVLDQIDDHAFSVSRHLLKLTSDIEHVRRAVAAESRAIPLRDNSVDLVLASWSVPTVQEEQIAMMEKARRPVTEVTEAKENLLRMLRETCVEYGRLVRQGGHVITFPIRDPELVDAYLEMMGGDQWQHTVCSVYDASWYAEVNPKHENYLVFSSKIQPEG